MLRSIASYLARDPGSILVGAAVEREHLRKKLKKTESADAKGQEMTEAVIGLLTKATMWKVVNTCTSSILK